MNVEPTYNLKATFSTKESMLRWLYFRESVGKGGQQCQAKSPWWKSIAHQIQCHSSMCSVIVKLQAPDCRRDSFIFPDGWMSGSKWKLMLWYNVWHSKKLRNLFSRVAKFCSWRDSLLATCFYAQTSSLLVIMLLHNTSNVLPFNIVYNCFYLISDGEVWAYYPCSG